MVQVFDLTESAGVDIAIEAVGFRNPSTTVPQIVRPGGSIANIRVHGKQMNLVQNELWIKNIKISMGLVNSKTLGILLKLIAKEFAF